MGKYYRDQITECMLLKIEQEFYQRDLKVIALESIAFKKNEGLLFGELTLLHHEMVGGKAPDIFKAAAAVEMLVLSFDIFDDLQDNDNSLAPWCIGNPALTLNLALGLFSLSTQTINELQSAYGIKSKFDFFNLKAINGQHADLLNAIETEEQYIDIVSQKSGSLLALAGVIGTSLATNTNAHFDLIKSYCTHLGIAEQIKNDLNDSLSHDKNDWLLRKKSLPILYLLESNHESIISDYYKGQLTYDELLLKKAAVKEILFDSGSMMYAQVILRKHQLLAAEQINLLPIENHYKTSILNKFEINYKGD